MASWPTLAPRLQLPSVGRPQELWQITTIFDEAGLGWKANLLHCRLHFVFCQFVLHPTSTTRHAIFECPIHDPGIPNSDRPNALYRVRLPLDFHAFPAPKFSRQHRDSTAPLSLDMLRSLKTTISSI